MACKGILIGNKKDNIYVAYNINLQSLMALTPLKISVVTTMLNERENVPYLIENIDNALKGFTYEVIFVDDGSTDGTVAELQKHLSNHHHIVLLKWK